MLRLLCSISLGLILQTTQLMAQQFLLDQPVRAGEVTFFPDIKDPNTYYYLSDKAGLSYKSDGTPEFSFFRYVEGDKTKNSSVQTIREGTGGGILHMIIELSVPEDILEDGISALKAINPAAVVKGPAIYDSGKFALISSFVAGDGKLSSSVVGVGSAPILDGHKAAISIQLTKQGAKILWETFKTPTPDMSFSFEMTLSGYLSPIEAKLEANFDQIYKHKAFDVGVATPVLQAEVTGAFTDMIKNGAIKITGAEADDKMDRLIEMTLKKLTDMMMEPLTTSTNNLDQLAKKQSSLDKASRMLSQNRFGPYAPVPYGGYNSYGGGYGQGAGYNGYNSGYGQQAGYYPPQQQNNPAQQQNNTVPTTNNGSTTNPSSNTSTQTTPQNTPSSSGNSSSSTPPKSNTPLAQTPADKSSAKTPPNYPAPKPPVKEAPNYPAPKPPVKGQPNYEAPKPPVKGQPNYQAPTPPNRKRSGAVTANSPGAAAQAPTPTRPRSNANAADNPPIKTRPRSNANAASNPVSTQAAPAKGNAATGGAATASNSSKKAGNTKANGAKTSKSKPSRTRTPRTRTPRTRTPGGVKAIPPVSIAAAFHMKEVKMSGKFEVTFNKMMKDSKTFAFAENIGNVKCSSCFHEINLDEVMFFKQRDIRAFMDGLNAKDFENYINYVTVVLRKPHQNGKVSAQEIIIDRSRFNDKGNNFTLSYGVNGDKNYDDWLKYEYEIKWNFFGDNTVNQPKVPTYFNGITLSPPYRRRVIQLEADPAFLTEQGVRLATVKIYYKLGEEEYTKVETLNPSSGIFTLPVEYISPEQIYSYDYEITWRLRGGKVVNSGRKTSESSVLFVDELPESDE